jgi:hypothetical protein
MHKVLRIDFLRGLQYKENKTYLPLITVDLL